MRSKLIGLLLIAVTVGTIFLSVGSARAATERIPTRWKNCTNVHKRYPHGVGKRFAHDHISGTPVPTSTAALASI